MGGVNDSEKQWSKTQCEKPTYSPTTVDGIKRGDVISMPGARSGGSLYTHHAVVTGVDRKSGTVGVIEYGSDKVQERTYTQGSLSSIAKATYPKSTNDPETTVSRAQSRIGETKYDLQTNNCEHFANWAKSGVAYSDQVETIVAPLRYSHDPDIDPNYDLYHGLGYNPDQK